MKKGVLTKSITENQFDKGYWYVDEIKKFAKEIGIPLASKLRKDELEELIKHFLKTGQVKSPTRKDIIKTGIKDIEKGLTLSLPVINYSDTKETKDFTVKEALKIVPDLKRKSGAKYRLNRWREEQITKGLKITYKDLVKQYIKLNQFKAPFKKVPVGRYINFISDYLAHEKNPTMEKAINAWVKLKELNIPKNYQAYKKEEQK